MRKAQRMIRCLQVIVVVISCLSHLGCSTTAIIEVESTRRADLVGITDIGVVYQLLPSDSIYSTGSVYFDDFSSQVETVLVELGFVPVSQTGQHKTDITIEMSYGISGPIYREYSYYDFVSYENCCPCPPSHCNCSASYYSQSMGHSSGHTSAVLRTGSYKVYRRTFELIAIDSGSDDESSPAWKTTATSTGRSDDLQAVFPLLLSAIEPYIGKNQKRMRLRKNANDLQTRSD